MVHVRTVSTTFHARVIAARLGADGIVTQLRGNIGGPYPFGEVSVWVGEDDADEAGELLLADEVEAAFAPDPSDEEPFHRAGIGTWTVRQMSAAAGLVLIAVAAVATVNRGLF
ncbi:MAG TPA: hypothetical protein VGG23_10940 [Acidimicrobiales bacterium]